MEKIIFVKHSNKGIGLDFHSETDRKKYLVLRERLETENIDTDDLIWDIDNETLTHDLEEANYLLNQYKLKFKH